MSSRKKTNLLKYGITLAVIVCVAVLYIFLHKGFGEMAWADRCRVLCDAFTIPGIVALMVGILIWVTNQGALTGLGYVTTTGLRMLIPGKGLDKPEKYADYVQRKRENRITGYGFLFVSGGIALAVAAVFLVLFYTAL